MPVNTYLTADEQARLERVTVGIAGAGGLGSNVAAHLVRDQIGRRKVDALAENLRRIEPDLDLALHAVRLAPDNLQTIFGACDVVVEAFDNVESKAALLATVRDRPVVSASGLAGWGRSNEMKVRRVGPNLVIVGDCASEVRAGLAPQSARVGIAAAMQANAVLALLLGSTRL